MRTVLWAAIVGVALGSYAAMGADEVAIGKTAPDFCLTNTQGGTNSLAAAKGKCVVLEWTNYDCPFVKRHYGPGAMQKLQKMYTEKGVVWFSINSSASGKQGNYPPEKWNEMIKERGAAATAVLLDPDGKVGKLYGAKTTPHIFIVNAGGVLVYMGAVDDKRTFKPEEAEGATNYVQLALDAALAGKPVETPATQAYGCSVKY